MQAFFAHFIPIAVLFLLRILLPLLLTIGFASWLKHIDAKRTDQQPE